jgi:hypothetical protein
MSARYNSWFTMMHFVGTRKKMEESRNQEFHDRVASRAQELRGVRTSRGLPWFRVFNHQRDYWCRLFSTKTKLTPIITLTVDMNDRHLRSISMIDRHDVHSHMRAKVRCDTVGLTRFRVGRPPSSSVGAAPSILQDERLLIEPLILLEADRRDRPIAQGRRSG